MTHLKISQQIILGEVQKVLWSPLNAIPQKEVLPLSRSYSAWEQMSGCHQIQATFFLIGLDAQLSDGTGGLPVGKERRVTGHQQTLQSAALKRQRQVHD